MEVKIGVTNVTRELTIDTDLDADGIEQRLQAALTDGSTFALSDVRGRRVVVPAERLAYVDISISTAGQVGFRS